MYIVGCATFKCSVLIQNTFWKDDVQCTRNCLLIYDRHNFITSAPLDYSSTVAVIYSERCLSMVDSADDDDDDNVSDDDELIVVIVA